MTSHPVRQEQSVTMGWWTISRYKTSSLICILGFVFVVFCLVRWFVCLLTFWWSLFFGVLFGFFVIFRESLLVFTCFFVCCVVFVDFGCFGGFPWFWVFQFLLLLLDFFGLLFGRFCLVFPWIFGLGFFFGFFSFKLLIRKLL